MEKEDPMHIAFAAPAAAPCTNASERTRSDGVTIRLTRVVVGAWLRSVERRTEAALRQLDHAGLLEDFQASRRG
jgi:hypothetical protein